jgi:succinoglycan biosynthesis protein ExoA
MTAVAPLPSLSVVIPALNAASVIEACLEAVFAQHYSGALDVTVALAPSDDRTQEILDRWQSKESRLQVVANPSGRTPTALNLAIAASTGDLVARVDAQSILPPGYLQQAATTLERTGAANVGGVQHPVGDDGMQRTIALAMRSPFGAGPASFRGHGQEGPVDTVYLGTFTRAALEAVDGFNESYLRNQDYELNWRLREAGFTVWFDPNLVVDYQPRPTLKKLASQYVQYGAWKRRMLLKNPRSLRLRQLAAPGLVLGLSGSFLVSFFNFFFSLILPIVYLAAILVASITVRHHLTVGDRLRLSGVFLAMHLTWGFGFLFLSINESDVKP